MNSLQQYKRSHNAPELKACTGPLKVHTHISSLRYDFDSTLKGIFKILEEMRWRWKQACITIHFSHLLPRHWTDNEEWTYSFQLFRLRTCNCTGHSKLSMDSINIKASLPVIGDPCLFCVCMKSLRN